MSDAGNILGGIWLEVGARLDKLESSLKQAEATSKASAQRMQKTLGNIDFAGNVFKAFAALNTVEAGLKGVSGIAYQMRGEFEKSAEAFRQLPMGLGQAYRAIEGIFELSTGLRANIEAYAKGMQEAAQHVKSIEAVGTKINEMAAGTRDMQIEAALMRAGPGRGAEVGRVTFDMERQRTAAAAARDKQIAEARQLGNKALEAQAEEAYQERLAAIVELGQTKINAIYDKYAKQREEQRQELLDKRQSLVERIEELKTAEASKAASAQFRQIEAGSLSFSPSGIGGDAPAQRSASALEKAVDLLRQIDAKLGGGVTARAA